MASLQPISAPEQPVSKGLSWPDVQALGLVLVILMVINLPLYQSVLQVPGKPAPSRIASVHFVRPYSMKTAFAKTVDDRFKTDVSSLTKASGASNRSVAR